MPFFSHSNSWHPMKNPKPSTCFNILAVLLPWMICAYFLAITLAMPEKMALYIAKDQDDAGGLVENLTVFTLIPGIVMGLYAFIRYRTQIRPWWAAYWLLIWILACIYFAGEEASWGQWYFGWETPETYSQINDQNETNLHNTSTWLDQKPRALVEIWIFVTGFILPLASYFRDSKTSSSRFYWIHPLPILFSSAAFFTLVRMSEWIKFQNIDTLFGSSEFREFTIALFLTLFLLSYFARLSKSARQKTED